MNTVTYSLHTMTGDILNLSNIPYGMSLENETIRVFGSPGEDSIYVGPGLNLDLTDLGLGNDKLYFNGAFDDYTQSIDQDTAIYTFTHKTRTSEVVRVQSMGQNDMLYFADGHYVFNANEDSRLYNVDTWESFAITAAMLEPGGTPVPQSDATVTVHGVSSDTGASGSDYVTNDDNGLTISASLSRPLESLASQGAVGASLPMRIYIRGLDGADIPYLGLSGQSMQITGSAGADNIYVGLGVAVDARSLGAGNDGIYFTGALDDYTQVIDQDTGIYTFTHNIRSNEIVQVTSMGEDDVLYFADGHIVFNAIDDTRLYNELTGQFVAIDASWLAAGGSPLITEKLQYSKDGGATWQDVNESIGPDGTTVTLNDPTLTSSANIQFRVTNQASSGAVTSQQVTIDTVAPATPSTGLIAGDDDIAAGERPTATVQGTAEANAFIELSFSGGFTRTTQADGSGNWSYSLTGADFTAMGIGAETVSATATDLAGNTNGAQDDRAFNVQSLDATPPEITGPSAGAGAASSVGSAAENTTAVHTFIANEAVTWSLNGGVDAAHFSIDANTGELIFQSAPDYDAPADDGADNTYTVVVRAVDGNGNASNQTVTISVTNANDNTPTITSGAAASFAENSTGTVYTSVATDADGALHPITYAIGGTDAALFDINASTGAVTFKVAPDFEAPTDAGADNVYNITVTASDGTHTSPAQAVAITVTNTTEPGEPIDLGTLGQLIFPVVVDGGQVYYAWDRNADGIHNSSDGFLHNVLDAIFRYDVNGVLEAAGNAVGAVGDTDNTYRYASLNGVQVALPVYGGAMSGNNASQFGYRPGTAIDNNPEGEVNPTYDGLLAISDAHNGAGTGTNVSGVPSGWNGSGFWSATPSSSGHAFVQLGNGNVTDGIDSNNSLYVALQVLSQITSTGAASTAENVATSAVIYDANGWTGDGILTWSLLGTDAARFTIDADDGEVRFLASPDFEAPTDAGANNVYDITVRGTTSNGGWVDKTVAITVTNELDAVPVFTSASTATVFEDIGTSIAVYDAQTNVEGVDGATYTLGGADAALFDINASTGAVTFQANPSVAADTVYNIEVTATNAVGSDMQAVAITVKDNSPISLGTEGQLINPIVVDGGQMYYAWDRNGDGLHNNSISGGKYDYTTHDVLDAIFRYDVNGVLETAGNAVGAVGDTDNTYRYASLNGVQVALPTYGSTMSGNNASPLLVYKNGTAIDNNPVGEVNATYDGLLAIWDAHNGSGTGTDISGTPSGWSVNHYWSATPSPTGHATVTMINGYASESFDHGNNYLALQVLSQITSTGAASTAENVASSAVIYDANGWTSQGDTSLTWSLQGADAARFTIDADDGEVRFLASPDFEAPTDAGANNVYDITVRGTTSNGGWVDKTVAITVTNDLDAVPVFTSASTATVFEDIGTSIAVYDAQTNVEGGDGATYTLGGADAALFNINASTGAVTFQANPSVAADTVYNIEVTATNAVGSDMQAVAITVKDNSPIDLGTYGQLLNPVVVDGEQVYYVWDINKNGSLGTGDTVTHNWLDAIFRYDVNGVLETAGNAVGAAGDTDNTYRYATINGVQVALPVYGHTMSGHNASPPSEYKVGTAIDNSPVGEVNPTYDGLLAIWDAHNGGGDTGTNTAGVPPGWGVGSSHYFWSATPSPAGHAAVILNAGSVYDFGDTTSVYVALQVSSTLSIPTPTISSVALTSGTDIQNGLYNTGDVITASVTFNELVNVTGTPRLALDIGGATVQANYAGGSGSATLIFTYTLLAGQADANGISIGANALSLNGGTISGPFGLAAATLTHALVADGASYVVDAVRPTVTYTSVAFHDANDTLMLKGTNLGTLLEASEDASTDIKARLDWSKLSWDIDGNTATTTIDRGFVLADIASARVLSNNTLEIILTPDRAAALEATSGFKGATADRVDINTGFSRDLAGNAATTDTGNNLALTAPAVTSVALTSGTGGVGSLYTAGDVITASLSFNDAVTVTGTPQLGLNIGGTTVQASYSGGTGSTTLTFTYAILAGQTDTNGISIAANQLSLNGGTIRDASSNNATLTHALVADNASYQVDTVVPDASYSYYNYNSSTNVLTLYGSGINKLLNAGETSATDIKARLDWSKLSYDINGNTDQGTVDIGFALGDISSAFATNDTTLTITVTGAKATALEGTSGFGVTGGYDTIDIVNGFGGSDPAGNTASADGKSNAGVNAIDLGTYGQLLNSVVVDGGQVYYVWDINKNGSLDAGDTVPHNWLDAIFRYDVNGVLETAGNAVGAEGDTDNTYRYATINGVQVALPVYGHTMSGHNASPPSEYKVGTAIDNSPVGEVNPTYDGLLAIWDAHNGGGDTGTDTNGVPSGWGVGSSHYFWSATPSPAGHAAVILNAGSVYDFGDTISVYVALQVL